MSTIHNQFKNIVVFEVDIFPHSSPTCSPLQDICPRSHGHHGHRGHNGNHGHQPVFICKISVQGVKAKNDLPPSSTAVVDFQAADGRPVAEHFQLDTEEKKFEDKYQLSTFNLMLRRNILPQKSLRKNISTFNWMLRRAIDTILLCV